MIDPPYLADTEAYFILGIDAATSLINLSPNALADGSFVGGGAGTFDTHWAKLNINYSLNSGVSYAGINKTIVSISEFQKDQHSSVVAPHVEFSIVANAFRVRVAASGYLFGAGDVISIDVPYFQGLTSAGGSGNDTAYIGRHGTLETATAADAPVTAGNISFGPRGGRDSISDTTGHKHYIGLIYDRELSGAEMAEIYAWAATELAKKYVLVA